MQQVDNQLININKRMLELLRRQAVDEVLRLAIAGIGRTGPGSQRLFGVSDLGRCWMLEIRPDIGRQVPAPARGGMLIGPIMLLVVVPALRMMFLEPDPEVTNPAGAGDRAPAE